VTMAVVYVVSAVTVVCMCWYECIVLVIFIISRGVCVPRKLTCPCC